MTLERHSVGATASAAVRTYASRHGPAAERPVLSCRLRGRIVQGGGPPERLRGVQDVVPRVDAPFESTSVRVDASRLTFADFYRATFTDMTQLALLLTGSAETAHDLVQDSFVRLHGKWSRVDDPRAYLRRSVVNACHSHHRRLHVQLLRRHLAAPRVDVVELDADEMVDAIAALPCRQRAAIVLRFWHDSSEAEIAATLGCRPGTVGSLIHRALAELRKAMP
jgi:RNA polymerase sigma-70 factor (sigma-E family)